MKCKIKQEIIQDAESVKMRHKEERTFYTRNYKKIKEKPGGKGYQIRCTDHVSQRCTVTTLEKVCTCTLKLFRVDWNFKMLGESLGPPLHRCRCRPLPCPRFWKVCCSTWVTWTLSSKCHNGKIILQHYIQHEPTSSRNTMFRHVLWDLSGLHWSHHDSPCVLVPGIISLSAFTSSIQSIEAATNENWHRDIEQKMKPVISSEFQW